MIYRLKTKRASLLFNGRRVKFANLNFRLDFIRATISDIVSSLSTKSVDAEKSYPNNAEIPVIDASAEAEVKTNIKNAEVNAVVKAVKAILNAYSHITALFNTTIELKNITSECEADSITEISKSGYVASLVDFNSIADVTAANTVGKISMTGEIETVTAEATAMTVDSSSWTYPSLVGGVLTIEQSVEVQTYQYTDEHGNLVKGVQIA